MFTEHRRDFFEITLGVLVLMGALLARNFPYVRLALFLFAYIIVSYSIIWSALKNILHKKFLDENFLMTIATGGAIAIREFPEAVAVMLFFRIGELLEDFALNRSRHSIQSLMNIRAEYANIKRNGQIKKVPPARVPVGSMIVVRPGERIPLDGVIVEGDSLVDTSALTGEPRPRALRKGDAILSGMINTTGLLNIRVTKVLAESTVSKILNLVEHARSRKSPTERFITRFARSYTPGVVALAILIAVVPPLLYRIPLLAPLFSHAPIFSQWLYRALIFLVIACPCALVISIPLGFFGGIGAASRKGILVKGSNFLEGLNRLSTIVYDKTGTLTKGVFRVTAVVSCNGYSKDELLKLAAKAEAHSNHPIAQSICEAYGKEVDDSAITDYEEISGYGVKAIVEGKTILAGNDKLLHRENIAHTTCHVEGTVIHLVVNRIYAGYLVISDEIKANAKHTIALLRRKGVGRQIMLTGDSRETAESVSQQLGLDGFHAELLPHEKVKKIEELIQAKSKKEEQIAFVGDGINDAPVIARSDIGIAMGALGSDAAIEAADIVLMTDDLTKIPEAMYIAKRTRIIVWQNIAFALGIKALIMGFALLGMATMWEAIFADMGAAILAILNASRTIRGIARENRKAQR